MDDSPRDFSGLAATLAELAGSLGHFGAAVRDVATGRQFFWHADEPFPAASVIKVPVMIEVYRQAHAGRLRLSTDVMLTPEDLTGGSGVLGLFSPGLRLPLRDLVELMICVSDNSATNVLLDHVGIEPVNEGMRALGLRHTLVRNKLQILPVPRTGVNQTSPLDMVELMSKLALGQVVSGWACERMIDTLKRQHYNDIIPARLPILRNGLTGSRPSIEVAHKTGWFSGVRADAGIIYAGQTCLAMALMARDLTDDTAAIDVMARMARAMYDAATSNY